MGDGNGSCRTTRAARIWSAALGLCLVLFVSFVFYGLLFAHPQGDFVEHREVANELGESGKWLDYSFWYGLQYLLAGQDANATRATLVTLLIAILTVTFRFAVAWWYGRSRGLGVLLASGVAIWATLAMPLVDPRAIWDASRLPDVYLGQLSQTVWHNSTTLLMVGPAALSLIYFSRFFDTRSYRAFLVGIAWLAVATLAKPNFTLAFLPALLLALGIRKVFQGASPGVSWPFLSWRYIVPALLFGLLLSWQLYTASSGQESIGRTVLVLDPWVQWRSFTDNIALSTARSLVLPLFLTLVLWRRGRLNSLIGLAWATLTVAVAQFVLFSEEDSNGQAVLHGNWYWGIVPSLFVLMLALVAEFAVDLRASWSIRRPFDRLIDVAIGISLGASMAGGVYYAVGIGLGSFDYMIRS